MIRREKDGIEWLEFEQLQGFSSLVHGVFLRHGGVSEGPYASLNIGGGSGDDPKVIAENRRLAAKVLGLNEFVSSKQVHGDRVLFAKGGLECDGLITKEKELPLLIKHADCQAALFFDPINEVIAGVHCGWRGSVLNIYAKAVAQFSNPENLLVCISPSLGPKNAEFIHYREELPKSFLKHRAGECHFDFWAISKEQLVESGVLPHHIECANLCTFAEKDDFFSFRREKKTGRHGTVIALKDRAGYQEH